MATSVLNIASVSFAAKSYSRHVIATARERYELDPQLLFERTLTLPALAPNLMIAEFVPCPD